MNNHAHAFVSAQSDIEEFIEQWKSLTSSLTVKKYIPYILGIVIIVVAVLSTVLTSIQYSEYEAKCLEDSVMYAQLCDASREYANNGFFILSRSFLSGLTRSIVVAALFWIVASEYLKKRITELTTTLNRLPQSIATSLSLLSPKLTTDEQVELNEIFTGIVGICSSPKYQQVLPESKTKPMEKVIEDIAFHNNLPVAYLYDEIT